MKRIFEITAAGVSEFERWTQVRPETPVSAESDLVALKLAATSNHGSALEWLPQTLAELDEKIAAWQGSIERFPRSIPRLASLTARYRLRALEHRRAYLSEAMRIPREGVAERVQRILVADDSTASRAHVKYMLTAAGYEVHLAEDGAQAWERMQSAKFDVVILDVLMPEPDGLAVLRRIRACPDLACVPVIVNTGRGDSADRDAALAAGADTVVYKNREDSGRRLVDSVQQLIAQAGNRSEKVDF